MDHTIALRISRAFNDISGIINVMEDVPNVLVYQHDPDEDVKRIHCHFLIQQSPIDKEGLKKRILKLYKFHGNADWSVSPKEYESPDKYITYMSKGQLDPVFNKGYDTTHIGSLRALWQNAISAVSVLLPPQGVVTAVRGKTLNLQQNLTDQYQAYLDELLVDVSTMSPHLTLDSFRGPSLLYWRKRNGGLLPQTSTYKRFLASLYLEYRDHKRLPLAEEAIESIKNFYG